MEKRFEKEFLKAVSFTLERVKKEGGFGATPKLPATLEDTYHGLRILDRVGHYLGLPDKVKINKELHGSFLQRFVKKDPSLAMKGAFQLIWCMKKCGLNANAQELSKNRFLKTKKKNSEDAYYALRISKLLEATLPWSYSKEEISKMAAFRGILFRRWMALFIDLNLKAGIIPKMAAVNWIKRCQNYDGGFGFLPGSTSYLENSHFALRALDCLHERPAKMENAERFVLACQTKAGGFSRKADAAPFLDSTWHGVAALWHIAKQHDRL